VKSEPTYSRIEAQRIAADHDGARRSPPFCPVCHHRHPCDVYSLAEDVVILHDRLVSAFKYGPAL